MSCTSSPASARCSRALSWMRRSVAISEISRSTSAVSRSGGIAATAVGSSRARQMVRSSAIDLGTAPRRESARARLPRTGFGGAAVARSGDVRRRAGAAAEAGHRARSCVAARTAPAPARLVPAPPAAPRHRGGIEQPTNADLARQFEDAAAKAAAGRHRRARPASRRCRPAAAGRGSPRPPSSSARLPPAGGSGRRGCRRG